MILALSDPSILKKSKVFLLFIVFLAISQITVAQPGVLGSSISDGSYVKYNLNTIGGFKQYRLQATTSVVVSARNWEFASGTAESTNYTPNWRPYTSPNTLSSNTFIPTSYANGAKYNSGGGSSGLLPAITGGNYYTFNVSNNSVADNVMQLLETTYNPITFSSVSQSVGSAGAENISITTSGTPNASENIYVRYSTNSYSSSTLVQATGSGTSWTAVIPWQPATTSYYVYSSNKTLAQINADVTSYGQGAHDMSTLNLNNNAGSNYSWSFGNIIVKSAGGSASTGAAYTTLTVAGQLFSTLNTGTAHTGAVTVYICANTTETGATSLNNSTNWTSINLQPVGAITISGSPTGGTPLMNLNGADNVTIDGLNTGGNSLTIGNTTVSSTTGTSTIRFINDATTNTIQNCTIKGSTTDAAAGIIFFSTASTGAGNDGNTITLNNITNSADANRPLNAIYSAGTLSMENSGNIISNNNIYNFLNQTSASSGIQLAANNLTWTISGNSLYESTTFTPTSNTTFIGINVSDITSAGIAISGNYIGGNSASCGGTWTKAVYLNASQSFTGINMNAGTSTTSNVQNNTIKNITWTNYYGADWTGINIVGGNINIGTVTGNTIGATTGTSSIILSNGQNAIVSGINIAGTGTVDCQNNSIGAISTSNGSGYTTNIYGINKTAVAGTTTINNNIIGSVTTPLSINATSNSSNSQNIIGINNLGTGTIIINGNTIANLNDVTPSSNSIINGICSTGDASIVATNTISNNTIHDLSINNANPYTDNLASICGIEITDLWHNKQKTVSGNTIYNLTNSNASFAGNVIGLYFQGSATGNVVSGNFIHDLFVTGASSTTANIYGIKIGNGGTTYSNNIISLGGNTKTTIYGMYDIGNYVQDCNMIYNTIYIGGSLVSGTTNKSYCVYSDYDGFGNDIRNNIFSNTRSTISGTSLHYGLWLNYYTSLGATFKVSNNDYYASGTAGVLGNWSALNKTTVPIVTGETNSNAINPTFSNSGGTTNIDYKIATSSLVAVTGTGITTDYAAISRSGSVPIMGAYESLIPLITTSTSALTGFQYAPGAGPSLEQTFTVNGANLIANLVVTPSTNFEISLTSGGAFAATNPITLSQTGGIVATTTIYVRLKTGLATATYTPENLTVTSTGTVTKNVGCSGAVAVIPTILSSATSLSNFNYVYGAGPSTQQSYTVSGTNLTSNITVTPPTDFEISITSGSGFISTPITLTQSSGTVVSTTIYVRMKSGLSQANYSGENIVMTATSAFTKNVACSGSVNLNVEVWKGTYQSSYSTLKGAFDAINAGTHTGTLEIKIAGSTTETAAAILNASGTGASSFTTIHIYPTQTGLSITNSGSLNELIDLNGADNVTIDGRVNATGTTKDLIITNTNITATSTIRFINDASNNIVKYCNVKGSSTYYDGILFFSTSTGSTGNDGNLIDNNNITCSSNGSRPINAICSTGSVGFENSENTISNNNIFDFLTTTYYSIGINLGNYTTGWTITGNSFYETTSIAPSGAYYFSPIYINNTAGNGFVITGNYIGGNAQLAAGTHSKTTGYGPFYGIYLNVGTAVASSVQNNIIRNYSWICDNGGFWTGIHVEAGNVNIGTITGNTIGAATSTGSIVASYVNSGEVNGININSAGVVDCQNNIIGAITASNAATTSITNFFGIHKSAFAGTTTISNNQIGSTITAHSIEATSTNTYGGQVVYGIYSQGTGIIAMNANSVANLTNRNTSANGLISGITSASGTNTITNNLVRDLTIANSAGTGATASITGISLNSTSAAKTITGNNIYNLKNTHTSFTGDVIGLYFQGNTGANVVSGNFIHSLSVTGVSSAAASIYGIRINSGATTYSNNIVSLGGSSKTTLYGIYDTGAASQTCNLYFNTVYIGGSVGSGATNKSYCLYSAAASNTRNYRNNVFSNVRSTTAGASLHYGASLTANTNLTSNYNDYYASGTGGMLGSMTATDKSTLANWKTATTQDVNSLNSTPSFVGDGSSIATDYKVGAYLPAISIVGFSSDYGVITRNTVPTMGVWESPNTWKGTVSSAWNVAGNWTGGDLPAIDGNILFFANPDNHCLLDADHSVTNITNASANNLVANGFKLTIKGAISQTSTGKIDASTSGSTVEFAGGSAQSIPSGAFTSVYDLSINNTANVILNGTLNLLNSVTATSGKLDAMTNTPNVTYGGTLAQTLDKSAYLNSKVYDLTINNTAGVSLSTDFIVNHLLTINSGKTLTIPTIKLLNIEGTISNTSASGIVVKASTDGTVANGSLIFHNGVEAPVSATVEMYDKATIVNSLGSTTNANNYRWQYFGIPLRSTTPFGTFNGSYIRRWNHPTSTWVLQQNASTLTSFTGYEVAQAAAKTITYAGVLENGDFTTTLDAKDGTTNAGQYIFANPYTAAIDIKLLTFGAQTDNSVYLFNTGSASDWSTNGNTFAPGNNAGQYVVCPKLTAGDGQIPRQIPSMQGFVVKDMVAAGDHSFGIPYSSVMQNTSILRAPNANTSPITKVFTIIDVKGTRFADRMWVFTDPICTHNFDNGWDGRKLLGTALTPQIYALEVDGNYQVNAVNDINNTDLAFQAGEDTNYMLTFTHQNLESAYSTLYLIDLLENKTIDISQTGTEYNFTAAITATPEKRFKIVTSAGIATDNVNTNGNGLKLFTVQNKVIVHNFGDSICHLTLYDINGRIVLKTTISPQSISTIVTHLTEGCYVAKAKTENMEVTEKVILNKSAL